MELEKKTTFISGGGKNIGRSIALNLAGSGSNIVLNGATDLDACNKTAADVEKLGVKTMVLMGNVGSSDEVRTMSERRFSLAFAFGLCLNDLVLKSECELFLNVLKKLQA